MRSMKTLEILIAVDPTNTFCPGGEIPVKDGDKIMQVINNLTASKIFDENILVVEEHPRGHISFASRHPGKRVFDTITLPGGHLQILWPDHSMKDTAGCKPHPSLNLTPFKHRIIKGQHKDIDSHSALRDNDKKTETGLRELLEELARKHKIPLTQVRLNFVGLALDYCVGLSALDAREFGFNTRVIVDATRSVALETEVTMLRELAAKGVELGTSRELFQHRATALGASGQRRGLKLQVEI